MSLCDIAALNEMALRSTIDGKYSEGAHLLSRGLKQLKDYASGQDSLAASSDVPNNSFFQSNLLDCKRLSTFNNSEKVSPGNTYDFLPYAFSIKPPCHTVRVGAFHDIVASVMTYNFAIIHHQAGLTNGATRHFAVALRLYQQVVGNLKHLADDSTSVLLLVATANMAQIHAHFLNWQKAQRCMQCAIRITAVIDDELSSDILEGLFFHSMPSGNVRTVAPAA